METYKTSCDLNRETEEYFEALSKSQDTLRTANQFITDTLNRALSTQDLDMLLSLIPYIKAGDGSLAYGNSEETPQILLILQIILLERKYGKPSFSLGCDTKETLLEKYMLSLFSFRRLLFALSEDSVEEAVLCLQQIGLSAFAVYLITQNELIVPDNKLYSKIISLYSGFWDDDSIQLFLTLIHSNGG